MSVHRVKRPSRNKWILRVGLFLLAIAWVWIFLLPGLSGDSKKFLIAKHEIASGDGISIQDFTFANLSLAQAATNYVTEEELPANAVARVSIDSGSLVPKSSVISAVATSIPLVVTLTQPLSKKIQPGSIVDVWATESRSGVATGEPAVVVQDATVYSVESGSSMGQSTVKVELGLSLTYVPALLLAQANDSVLSLILNPTLHDAN